MPYYKFVSRANLNANYIGTTRAYGSSRNSNFEADVLENHLERGIGCIWFVGIWYMVCTIVRPKVKAYVHLAFK